MDIIEKINNIQIWNSYVSKEKLFFAKNIPLEIRDYEYYELFNVLSQLEVTEPTEITSKTYNKIEQILIRLKDLDDNFIKLENIPSDILLLFLCSDVPNAYYVFSPLKKFDSFLNENNLYSIPLTLKNQDKSKFIYGKFPLQYIDNLTNSLVHYNVNVFGYYFTKEKMLFIGYENNFSDQFSIDKLNNFYDFFELFDFNRLRILFEKENTKKLFNTGFSNQSFYTNHDTFKTLIGANLKSNFNPSDILNYHLKYCSGNISINNKRYNIGVSQNSKIWFMTQPTKFFTKFSNLKAISQYIFNQNNSHSQNNNFFHESKKISSIRNIVNCFLNYQKIYDGKPKTKAELNFIEFLEDLHFIKYVKSKKKVIISTKTKKIAVEISFTKEISIINTVSNDCGLSLNFISKKLIKYLVFLDDSYRKIDSSGFYYINNLNSLPMYRQVNMNTSMDLEREKPPLKDIVRYYNKNYIIDENKKYSSYFPTPQNKYTFNAFILYLYNQYPNHDYHLFCLDTHEDGGNWKASVPYAFNPKAEIKPKEVADFIYIEEIDKNKPNFTNETIKTQLIGNKIYHINFIHCKGGKSKHQSPNELNKVIGQIVNSIIYADFKNREELKKQLLGFYYQFNIAQHNNLIALLNEICEPQNQVIFEISICFPKYDLSNNHDYSQQLHSFVHQCQNMLSQNNIYFSFYY